ncbi:TauD/TfdA family dioxygenase [Metapseudomonas furukawaii]|uniref:TauD/TfdA dioxygenase family protein n=1 Tax=Metapseudomonas furukawaii TaxID=1149133 RepID=UPI002279FE5C|nr:TauD/TfdA family dioxygenase [Pseudomonas furukawaii]WAG81019.1 TauD/TfdA family dioxygenase [Pseudomonas furukawaii]
MKISKLLGGIGVQCSEIDLNQPIPPHIAKQLHEAWIEAGIVVFKNMGQSPEQQLSLSRCFGVLDVHPVKNLVTESQYPELMVLDSDAQAKLSVYYRESAPDQPFVGFIPWHSDLVFTNRPNHGAMLRAVETPQHGGETAWIDTIAAYAALPEAMKQRIEHLEVEYRFCTSLLDSPYGRDPLLRMQVKGERNFPAFPPVANPLVWRHPVSGRKVLKLSPLHLQRVVNMDASESHALLEELVTHVTSRTFCYVHHWEPDDMVLWDNWRTLHSALGYPLGDRRLVHRTTIGGDTQMGRLLETNQVA